MQYFRLEGSTIAPTDQDTWIARLNNNAHIVQVTPITQGVRVSTIFVGIDDRLFETKTIGGDTNGDQTNSATWTDALRAHALTVHRAYSRFAPDADEAYHFDTHAQHVLQEAAGRSSLK